MPALAESNKGIISNGTLLPSGAKGVIWLGADGNAYVKAGGVNGVVNVGSPDGFGAESKYYDFSGLKQISDPNAPVTAPGNPNGSSGGGGSQFQDKSNDIALQLAGLGSVDPSTNSAVDRINSSLKTLIGNYDTESGQNEGNYTTNKQNNNKSFQTNKQTSLVNAANGRNGLLGTLASIGALSGDGITLANNAVQHGANEDLAGAGNTFATNESSLDQAIGNFRTQDAARRKSASTAAENDIQSAKNAGASAKQKFFTNLADDYTLQGDKNTAGDYARRAAELYPEIGATSVPSSTITPQTAAYTPASLQSYLTGGNQVVSTTAGTNTGGSADLSQIPGLIAGPTKKQQGQ